MKRKEISLLLAGVMSLSIALSPFTGNIQIAKADTVVAESTQEENKSEAKIPGLMTVAEFDEIIKASGVSASVVARNKKQLLYQREFVKRVGYENLINLYNNENEYREGINELFTNETALSYYIETGLADKGSSYLESVKNFAKIYNEHKEDLEKDPEFLLKLAVSVSWSHATAVRFWTGKAKPHDPVTRYESYKNLVESGTMDKGGSSEVFKKLSPTMMKFTVNSRLHEDEVEWLADYALTKKASGSKYLDAYSYIKYTTGYNYGKNIYYNEQNRQKWDEKYNLSEYISDYGTSGVMRNFMVFEEGAVCGGLAKTYTTLAEVFGRPAQVVHQPGHAAAIVYEVGNDGKGYWRLKNDIFGWAKSRDELGVMPLTWGMQTWNSDRSASYVVLAQRALDDYDNYATALRMNILANVYKDDLAKYQGIHKEALKVQGIQVDSMVGLIHSYNIDKTKTSKDYLELAEMITNNFKYYPIAVVDLMNLIKGKISAADMPRFDLLKNNALIAASKATAKDVHQPEVAKQMANALLGTERVNLASFSFDGANANKIVINSKYDNSDIRVRYSLDGGNEWKETDEHVIELSKEEIESITPEKDIKVGLVGTKDIFNIDIRPGVKAALYANDLENRLIGNTNGLEYSLDQGKTWKDYTAETRIEGKKVVQARYKAKGVYLRGNSSAFTFNEDSNDLTRKYIPLKNITLQSFSTQQNKTNAAAKNLIDGNPNTIWHSKHNVVDKEKSFVVKFDKERYITALEYKAGGTANGRLKKAEVYTSLDGKEWTLSGTYSLLKNNTTVQNIPFNKPTKALYIKLKGVETYGNTKGEINKYISGSMLNFYEDATKLDVESEVKN